MIKRIVVILLLCSAVTVLFVACGGTSTPGGTTTGTQTLGSTTDTTGTNGSGNEVHMSYQTFVRSSMTISKGSSITLVDDVAVPHHIANGTWDNTTAKPMNEANAPLIDVQLNGNDQQVIGPFTTAGTYHLYCTIHPGMNLTIIVH